MPNIKFIFAILITVLILTGCSLVDKIKQKISSKQSEKTEQWEETTDGSSSEDMDFYNKYIAVLNKTQEAGENIYKDYMSSVPEPKSITKNSLIIPVSLQINVGSLERTIKEYKRSYFDGGELSKLKASDDMQNTVESGFKKLIVSMEDLHTISAKVSDYYSKREYENDLSKAQPYDDEIKASYKNFKSDIDMLSQSLKKYKPKRDIRDPASVSDVNERASVIMLNVYGNILDGAEEFYDAYRGIEFKSDLREAESSFVKFEKVFNQNKDDVQKGEFTERTKFMKYSFEDYFTKSADNFIQAGKKFFAEAPQAKNDNAFRLLYNDVINDYNRMIDSYNSSIGSINMIKQF
ncbi:MAG: DUF3829 domain-containing protein [bacterium]|nr:DUF3829 domain-containing protein [bacterium]